MSVTMTGSKEHAVAGTLINESQRDTGQYLLGTFKGVFVPTFQNIMGIILFLRLPWITGQAGIAQALGVVLLSCLASCLTVLSMSAVATNGKPASGGCYAIIKSNLGPQFGGTVGILLWLSNTFGVAMYVLGSVEVLQDWFPEALGKVPMRVLGAIILGLLFLIVFVGIKYITRVALLFLFGVMLAVISIYAGVIKHALEPDLAKGIVGASAEQFDTNWGAGYTAIPDDPSGAFYTFPIVLSIFFPAVTDPLAGSNLSGDLKDPAASIPPGTLAAVFVTTLVFSGQVLMCGSSVLRDTLLTDKVIVSRLAYPAKELIYIGVLLSTLGAGLQSLAGAPRLLEKIGRDGLIPQLSFLSQPGKEPRIALVLGASGSMACVMIGKLNGVAPFITMWFLTCYGIINGATAFLAFKAEDAFKPSWRWYDWRLSTLGACQCFFMMFLINWLVAIAALGVALLIFFYIGRCIRVKEQQDANSGAKV